MYLSVSKGLSIRAAMLNIEELLCKALRNQKISVELTSVQITSKDGGSGANTDQLLEYCDNVETYS